MKVDYFDARKPIRLKNKTCPYCGDGLSNKPSNEDHVIGRRFVPKGRLENTWNLIVQSCTDCNFKKSQLEDDISAITMQPDAFGSFAADDPLLIADSVRKGQARSRKSGKRVLESSESIEYSSNQGGAFSLSLRLRAPPSIEPRRTAELARMHLTAFFYWLTYDKSAQIGRWWVGDMLLVDASPRRDWGNTYQVSFAKHVQSWDLRLVAPAAQGHFMVAIRRNPHAECWSWALEWNSNLRVIGFFGNPDMVSREALRLETPKMKVLNRAPGSTVSYREEVPLSVQEDVLFDIPDGFAGDV